MDKNQKTDNFLNAIKKYADEKHTAMQNEVEQIKAEKLKEAEKTAKYDCEKLIKDKLEAKRNEQTSKIAKMLQDGQKKLFLKRSEMTESVFEKASEKLIEFTKTQKYSEMLINSAKEIADFFGCESCVLYVNERDMSSADKIKALFKGDAQVVSDKTVKIGGIKGFCDAMNIIADNTLDSKLYAQREWFIENSGLSIL
ncbi:MAG: V-type ATP synthase subunit E family protein [Ruminococcus sp.]|nr:V-type ATP synthase subunit E family protein [Ruminococcus sp.]